MLPLRSEESAGDNNLSAYPPRVPPTTTYQPFRHNVKPWSDSQSGPLALAAYVVILAVLGYAFVLPGAPLLYWLLTAVLVFVSLVLLVLTSQCDPGLIPPKPHKDPLIVLVETGEMEATAAGIWKGLGAQWCRQPEDSPEDAEPERYCNSCNIWRPERASHCTACSFCFERFDHHCGVLGTCVARDNHRFFVGFLMTSSSAALVMSAAGVMKFTGAFGDDSKPSTDEWQFYAGAAVLCSLLYTSIISCFACSHCVMLVCNVTSKQMAHSDRRPRGEPSHRHTPPPLFAPSCRGVVPCLRGRVTNIATVCFGRVRWKYASSRPYAEGNFVQKV